MEGEKFLMAAGVTAAVVVGAFVFWGPSGSSVLVVFCCCFGFRYHTTN